MIHIETKNCLDSFDSKRIERIFIEEVSASLNQVSPFVSSDEQAERNRLWKEKNKDDLAEQRKLYCITKTPKNIS